MPNQPSFELYQHYLDSQSRSGNGDGFHAHGTAPAITISRDTAAGAVTIGQMLVEELNRRNGTKPRAVFDRNLVEQVLKDHNLPTALQRFMPEGVTPGFNDVVEEIFGVHPSMWTLVEHTADTMRRLARLGHVVLVGRGANAVTAGLSNVLHVRLVGPFERRCKHAESFYHLSAEEAVKFVRTTDRAREQYMRRYFQIDINDPRQYDLTINTGRIGFEAATSLILDALDNLQTASGSQHGSCSVIPSNSAFAAG